MTFSYKSDPEKVQKYLLDHIRLIEAPINLARTKIEDLKEKRLNEIINNIPRFKGLKLDGFQDVPLLDKDLIRRKPETLFFDGVDLTNNIEKRLSSGSTGQPIEIWKSHDLFDFYSAISTHELIHHGWTPLDVIQILHGGGIGNLGLGITPNDLATQLINTRPTIVSCYPSYLLEMINLRDKENLLKNLNLNFICTHSEQSSAEERKRLEDFFNCRVFDEYGSTEVGPMAVQCKNGNYHILEDNIYLEVLNSNGESAKEGEIGELVVSDLRNEKMALIRYRIGDYGSIESEGNCGCQWNNFKVLKSLEGRIDDSFKLSNGLIIPTGQLISGISVYDRYAIKEWQIIQECFETFRIKYVKGETYNPESLKKLEAELIAQVGENASIILDEREKIHNWGAKRKLYKSLVK